MTRDGAAVGDGQTGRLLFATLERTAGFKPGDFVTVTIEEPPLDAVARLPATALDAADEVLALGRRTGWRVPVTLLRGRAMMCWSGRRARGAPRGRRADAAAGRRDQGAPLARTRARSWAQATGPRKSREPT